MSMSEKISSDLSEISQHLTPTKDAASELPPLKPSQRFFAGDKEISSFSEEDESSDDGEKQDPVACIPIKAGIARPTHKAASATKNHAGVRPPTQPASTSRRTTVPSATASRISARMAAKSAKTSIPTVSSTASPKRRTSTNPPTAPRGEPKMTTDKRIMMFRQQIEERATRIEKLEALLKEANQTTSRFEGELSRAKAEKENIIKQNAEAAAKSEEQLTRVTIELQVRLEAKDRQIKAFEGKLVDAQLAMAAVADEHGNQLAQLEQQLRDSAKETAHYKEKVNSLLFSQGVAEARAMEITRLRADLKAIQEAHQNYITTTEKISGQLGRQLTCYQQEVCELQTIIDTRDASSREMEQKLQAEADRLKSCQDKVAALERLALELRSRLNAAPSPDQLKEANVRNAQLESKLADEAQRTLKSQATIKELQVALHTLEGKLAEAPTESQLKEANEIGAQLKSELAKEKECTAQAKAKIATLETSIGGLQEELAQAYTYKDKHAHTQGQLQEVEQKRASLEKELTKVSAALTEQQSKASALENTISDLQRKLAFAPTLDQIKEIEGLKNALEVRLTEETRRGLDYQNKISDLEGSICDLEERLISAPSKSQIEELVSTKEALEASVAELTLNVEEKQAEAVALQVKLDAALTQHQTLEMAKLELVKDLDAVTKDTNSKEKLASAPTLEQVAMLQKAIDSKSQCLALTKEKYHQAEEKLTALTAEYEASVTNIKRELLESESQLKHFKRESAVARRIIKALREWDEASSSEALVQQLKAQHDKATSDLIASHQHTLKLCEAREKELLLKVATLVAQLEDRNYKPTNGKLQAAYRAAIAHSEKLSRELTEAKLSAARKISALNQERNQLSNEIQAHLSVNLDLMTQLETHKAMANHPH
ncbi:hypothetical protein L0F63_005793 [Massospora cicadina]|nr:hypothetical protein L0F63_005793 [Massospora cicadina]